MGSKPIGRANFDGPLSLGYRRSGKPRARSNRAPSGNRWIPISPLVRRSFLGWAAVLWLSNWVAQTATEQLVKTRGCGFTAIREANVFFGQPTCRTWEVHSRPETSKPPLVHPSAFSTGRRIGLSFITTWSPVRVRPPASNAGVAQLVEHVIPSSSLIRRFLIAIGQPGQSQWQRKRD